MAAPVAENFPLGLTVLPDGKQNPVAVIDKYGNARFDGGVSVGSLSLRDGATLGLTMDNNEFVSGLTTAAAVRRLIGVNTSNVVSIDTDALGVVFGAGIQVGSGSSSAPSLTFASIPTYGFYVNQGRVGVTTGGTPVAIFDNGVRLADTSVFEWSNSSDPFGAADTTISRSAANVLRLPGAVTIGTTTGIATSGTIRTAHNNQWLARDNANANNRNVIAFGVTTVDTVILGNPATATDINASTLRINGLAGFTGTGAFNTTSTVTVVNGIITNIA